jgi:hypothetical protein
LSFRADSRVWPTEPDRSTQRTLSGIGETIREIPAHRRVEPDVEMWGTGGMLAGMLFRLGSYSAGTARNCLNDSLVYLQARQLGWPVVTGNITDFDFLNQLVPDGRVLLHRKYRIAIEAVFG